MSSDFYDFNISHIFTFIRTHRILSSLRTVRPHRVRWALTFPPSLFLSGIPLHISSDYWMNSIENILNLFVLACFWTFCQIYRNLKRSFWNRTEFFGRSFLDWMGGPSAEPSFEFSFMLFWDLHLPNRKTITAKYEFPSKPSLKQSKPSLITFLGSTVFSFKVLGSS